MTLTDKDGNAYPVFPVPTIGTSTSSGTSTSITNTAILIAGRVWALTDNSNGTSNDLIVSPLMQHPNHIYYSGNQCNGTPYLQPKYQNGTYQIMVGYFDGSGNGSTPIVAPTGPAVATTIHSMSTYYGSGYTCGDSPATADVTPVETLSVPTLHGPFTYGMGG